MSKLVLKNVYYTIFLQKQDDSCYLFVTLIIVLPLRGPKIAGILPWYNIGDNFTANCTVKKSSPQAKLIWFINDAQVSINKI